MTVTPSSPNDDFQYDRYLLEVSLDKLCLDTARTDVGLAEQFGLRTDSIPVNWFSSIVCIVWVVLVDLKNDCSSWDGT
jgi:hypothetical protein